jgi:hypothetical protein
LRVRLTDVGNEVIHNSGAELASLSDGQLQEQLLQNFPGGRRWQGLTYELQRRAGQKQERLIVWTLVTAVVSIFIGIAALFF